MLAFGVGSAHGDGDCTKGLVEMAITWRCLWPLKDGGCTELLKPCKDGGHIKVATMVGL
jgi:hypothetical protein